jgi:hypothetical protein
MKHLFLRSVIVVAIGMSTAAHAADMPVKAPITPAPIEGWTFSLTPYGWVLSLNGSNTVKGRTTDVDAGFFDILRHTQFPKDLMELAAMGEARYGRFALLTDIVYLKAGLGASITRSRGTDAINGTVGASAGLKMWMVEAQFAAPTKWHAGAGFFHQVQAPRSISMLAAGYGGNAVKWI